jgi:protein-L-isoaspartate(D-aspartate) O-methyltransferase
MAMIENSSGQISLPNPVDAQLAQARLAMVETQLRQRGIHDPRVLAAMAKVPRHEFVEEIRREEAYADHPVPIAEGQTASQPYIIAAMLQAAEIKPEDRVLEIGAGSGYQTALLAELALQVHAVERYATLADHARSKLAAMGHTNVTIVVADGSLGWPDSAPYDAIIVSCAAPRVPPALLAQLAPNGRLVIPVGEAEQQSLQLIRKLPDGTASARLLEGCRFVPLIGEQGFRA